jgi:GNAT superfamily N-acetyltransferase
MALVERPSGTEREDVEVREVTSIDDLCSYDDVTFACFPFSPQEQKQSRAMVVERWRDYQRPESSTVSLLAHREGVTVGAAQATFAGAGVAMFGGAVVPEARGRGVYRALTLARWQIAQARGTPALTIMAGRMSLPIAKRLGFQVVGHKRLYFDEFRHSSNERVHETQRRVGEV